MRESKTTIRRQGQWPENCKKAAFYRGFGAAARALLLGAGHRSGDERRKAVRIAAFRRLHLPQSKRHHPAALHRVKRLMLLYGPEPVERRRRISVALNAIPTAGNQQSEALKGARRRLEIWIAPDKKFLRRSSAPRHPGYVTGFHPDGELVERVAVNGMRAAPGDVLVPMPITTSSWCWPMSRSVILFPDRARTNSAKVRLRAYPIGFSQFHTGNVTWIYPQPDGETELGRIIIELPNPTKFSGG